MTYSQEEKSQHRAKPRELYKFEGTYGNYYYTSQQEDVEYDDGTDDQGPRLYVAAPVKRSNVKIGTHEDDGLDLTVDLPVIAQVVQDYGFKIAPPKLRLTVYRYHSLDDVKTHWIGPVTGIRIAKNVASIKSPSVLSFALNSNCPSVYYQTPCNHILFDDLCKVSREDNTVETTVTAINDRSITVFSIGSFPATHFRGGELLLASGERRMIVAQSGNTVTVNYPFSKIEVGDACSVTSGCDHAFEGDCKMKYNNGPQYGGFVNIPNINPFMSGID